MAQIGSIWIDVAISEQHGVSAEVTEHPVEVGADVADHIRPRSRTITIEGLVTNHPLELPRSHAAGARVVPESYSIQVASDPLPRVPPSAIQIEGEPSLGALGIIPGLEQGAAILGALKIEVRSKLQFAAEQHNLNPNARTSYAVNALRFSAPFNRVLAVHAALLQIVESGELVTVVTGLMTYSSVALTDVSFDRSREVGPNALKFTATGRVLRLVTSQVVDLPKEPAEPRGVPAKSLGKQEPEETPPETLNQKNRSLLEKLLSRFLEAG